MDIPFTSSGGSFEGRPEPGGFGFGVIPAQQRRALHEARRQARREFREQLRSHGHGGPLGFG
ncbi:MAG: PadR family transcriptional regulator, partial [Mycobacterium sp.]